MSRPLISLLHASARPNQWAATWAVWMSRCDRPESVEYVLCYHVDDIGFCPPSGVRAVDPEALQGPPHLPVKRFGDGDVVDHRL